MIQHTVPDGVPALPIERYMRRAWPMLPGHVLRDWFKRRDVRVNGVKSDGKGTVSGGDNLSIYGDSKWLEPDAQVLWTDDKLIVAVKPQGLPVDVDANGIGADTLLTRLQRRWQNAALCHRLDAQTGGIVLAAVDSTVYAQALEAFKQHGVRKEYHAIAVGQPSPPEGTLKAWLQKDARHSDVRILNSPKSGAKPIVTHYCTLGEAASGLTCVALEPVTGRTHQLRAHMAAFGHPLLGDDHYGDREVNRRFSGTGLCLWHAKLTIPEDSPLAGYRGRVFQSPEPDWIIHERTSVKP